MCGVFFAYFTFSRVWFSFHFAWFLHLISNLLFLLSFAAFVERVRERARAPPPKQTEGWKSVSVWKKERGENFRCSVCGGKRQRERKPREDQTDQALKKFGSVSFLFESVSRMSEGGVDCINGNGNVNGNDVNDVNAADTATTTTTAAVASDRPQFFPPPPPASHIFMSDIKSSVVPFLAGEDN